MHVIREIAVRATAIFEAFPSTSDFLWDSAPPEHIDSPVTAFRRLLEACLMNPIVGREARKGSQFLQCTDKEVAHSSAEMCTVVTWAGGGGDVLEDVVVCRYPGVGIDGYG